MSSISSTSTSPLQSTQRPPHEKNRVASAISSEAASGAISSTDAAALTSALDSIDSSLRSGSATDSSSPSGSSTTTAKTRLDPASIKDRIDGLISDQVASGALTGDQATTLKDLFAKGGQSGGSEDGQGVGKIGGGKGRHGGPPPGPPPSDGADAASSTSGTASASGSTTSNDDLLATFIQQLKASQSSGTGYASSGSSGTGGNASALLFDFQS